MSIHLRSADDVLVPVCRDAAELSGTLQNLLEDVSDGGCAPNGLSVPLRHGELMQLVRLMEKFVSVPEQQLDAATDIASIGEDDQDSDPYQIALLMRGNKFFDCERVDDVLARRLAASLRGKAHAALRDLLRAPDDLNDEAKELALAEPLLTPRAEEVVATVSPPIAPSLSLLLDGDDPYAGNLNLLLSCVEHAVLIELKAVSSVWQERAREQLRRRYLAIRPEGTFQVGVHEDTFCERSGQSPIVGTLYRLPDTLLAPFGSGSICQAEFDNLSADEQLLCTTIDPQAIIDIDPHNAVEAIISSSMFRDQLDAIRQLIQACEVEPACSVVVTWQLVGPLMYFIENCEDESWVRGGVTMHTKGRSHAGKRAIFCALQLLAKLEPWMLVRHAAWIIDGLNRSSWDAGHIHAHILTAVLKPLAGSALAQFAPNIWKLLESNPGVVAPGSDLTRESAMQLLGMCGSNILSEHVSTIVQYLWDDEPWICWRAVALLSCVEPHAFVPHAPQVLQRLTDGMADVKSPFFSSAAWDNSSEDDIPHGWNDHDCAGWVGRAAWIIRLLVRTNDVTLERHAGPVQRLVQELEQYHSEHNAATDPRRLSAVLRLPFGAKHDLLVSQVALFTPDVRLRGMPLDQSYEDVGILLRDVAELKSRAARAVESSAASKGSKRSREETCI